MLAEVVTAVAVVLVRGSRLLKVLAAKVLEVQALARLRAGATMCVQGQICRQRRPGRRLQLLQHVFCADALLGVLCQHHWVLALFAAVFC